MYKKTILFIIFVIITVLLFSFCSIGAPVDNDDTPVDNDDYYDFTEDTTQGKTFYLDDQLSVAHTTTYSVENRDAFGSDGDAYNNLEDAINALSGGDSLIIRNGTYSRSPTYDQEVGAFDIGGSDIDGSPDDYTVIKTYPGDEMPVILTEPGKAQYNPDPGDTTPDPVTNRYDGSCDFYKNPAIGIHGNYIAVSGLKTYGQVVLSYSSNVFLENCDLGGGGPRTTQGNVISLAYWSYDIIIRNNKIHNSCWGSNNENGAAIIFYSSSAIIENNEFYDNWGTDIYVKDTGDQQGRTVDIRYNFFGPSTIFSGCAGIIGHNQQIDIDIVNVHNNVFLDKEKGIQWGTITENSPIFPYNNTFIDSGDMDIHGWTDDQRLYSYNNLLYHSNGKLYYSVFTINEADYNLFYSTSGTTIWKLEGTANPFKTSLSEWQTATNQDLHSVYTDPLFVNAGGNRPEDFKRQSYAGDVSGSEYGTVCGAYETGDETIGLIDR